MLKAKGRHCARKAEQPASKSMVSKKSTPKKPQLKRSAQRTYNAHTRANSPKPSSNQHWVEPLLPAETTYRTGIVAVLDQLNTPYVKDPTIRHFASALADAKPTVPLVVQHAYFEAAVQNHNPFRDEFGSTLGDFIPNERDWGRFAPFFMDPSTLYDRLRPLVKRLGLPETSTTEVFWHQDDLAYYHAIKQIFEILYPREGLLYTSMNDVLATKKKQLNERGTRLNVQTPGSMNYSSTYLPIKTRSTLSPDSPGSLDDSVGDTPTNPVTPTYPDPPNFEQTILDGAIRCLDWKSMERPFEAIQALAEDEEFQTQLGEAALKIERHTTGAVKERLAATLQQSQHIFDKFVEVYQLEPNDVLAKGFDIGTPPEFFMDPVRPVAFLAQVALFHDHFDNLPPYSENQKVQKCLQDAKKIFTMHHSSQSAKNVFMLLGPAGIGKSYFNSLLAAYVIKHKVPITVVKSPNHSSELPLFGSWSIDWYADDAKDQQRVGTYVCPNKGSATHQDYLSHLALHVKSFSEERAERVFILDPLEAHRKYKVNGSEATLSFHHLYRDLHHQSRQLFFSAHSIPLLDLSPDKTTNDPLINRMPNYTFHNMPLSHKTLNKLYTRAITSSTLYPQTTKDTQLRRLAMCSLLCAPTFRNYDQAIFDPKSLQTLADTAHQYSLDIKNVGLCKGASSQTPSISQFVSQSLVHDFNPDFEYVPSPTRSNPLRIGAIGPGTASTYVTPFLRSNDPSTIFTQFAPDTVIMGVSQKKLAFLD